MHILGLMAVLLIGARFFCAQAWEKLPTDPDPCMAAFIVDSLICLSSSIIYQYSRRRSGDASLIWGPVDCVGFVIFTAYAYLQ